MNDIPASEDNNTSRFVQSVGGAWIVCKSKSRSGHVYYFNTLTGNAVWNLSEVEVSSVRPQLRRFWTENTKKVDNQSSTCLPAKSPELESQPPMDISKQYKPNERIIEQPAQIFNQHVAPQIPNVAFPAFINNAAPLCNPTNNFTSLNTLNTFIPNLHNGLNPAINSLSLSNFTALYNPSVWAVPQQMLLSSNITSFPNQLQASLNVACNNIHQKIGIQNTANPELSNTDTTSKIENSPTKKRVFSYRKKFGQRKQNRNDLRKKIAGKRFQFNKITPFTFEGQISNVEQKQNTNFNRKDTSDESFKHISNVENASKLDLTPLRNLAAPNADPDTWFIVVDMDVIINEFKFLNILSDSDVQCRLVVPHHVMSELEHYVATTQDVLARRIHRFLSQQIEHGDVFLAEESLEAEDNDTSNMILATCLTLFEDNFHVVLLTNNGEIIKLKDSIPIKMFTPTELKRILKAYPNRSIFSNTRTSTFIPNRPVTNTIKYPEKDTNVSIIITTNKSPELPSTSCSAINKEALGSNQEQDNECSQTLVSTTTLKNTMDVAIQTDTSDFTDINASKLKSNDNIADKDLPLEIRDKAAENADKRFNTDAWTFADNITIKKRKIQLKRTTPTLSSMALAKNDKKGFKWHRRRNDELKVVSTEQNTYQNLNKAEDGLGEVCRDSLEEKLSNCQDLPRFDNSTASSDISVVSNNKACENITIEETSISDVISNTISNVDEESVNMKTDFVTQWDCADKKATISYKVEGAIMEESLVKKCDEWVSRFIQIMEESLSVILQHEPVFFDNSLPPPWTLYEATQCIKMKFGLNYTIKEAAFNLSNILLDVSDQQGKVNLNMKPSEYMEMYSHGVNLLNAIQDVMESCEDLQIAVESLKKLLKDIQNPNLDSSTHETFNDFPPDHATNSEDVSTQRCETPKNHYSPQKSPMSGTYNLRSNKKRKLLQVPESNSDGVKFIRKFDPEALFFTTLQLKKVESNAKDKTKDLFTGANLEENTLPKDVYTDDVTSCSKVESNDIKKYSKSIGNECFSSEVAQSIGDEPANSLNKSLEVERNTKNTNSNKESNKDTFVKEPRFIINFNKSSEFEDRIKNKYIGIKPYEDSELLDYDEDYEYGSEQYETEEDFDKSAGHDESDSEMDDEVGRSENYIPKSSENSSSNNNMKTFKYVIGMVLEEIREAFNALRNLCENYFEKAVASQRPKIKRIELQIKAKNVHARINDLCKSLDSMLARETTDSNNNIQALLRKAGLKDFYLDDKLKDEYRKTIAKCKGYAEVFSEHIQNILVILKS